MSATNWFLYIVENRYQQLYVGISTDVDRRFAEHQQGGTKAAKFLRGKGPLRLCYYSLAGDRRVASQLEYQIKRWSKAQKMQLIESQQPLTLFMQNGS